MAAAERGLRIVEDELGAVAGLRILHLQREIGVDFPALAQRRAEVVGLNFSLPQLPPRVGWLRNSACRTGPLGYRRCYDALTVIPEPAPAAFDCVYVTWGAICWLPDIRVWATMVARFLKPGGDRESHCSIVDRRQSAGSGRP